MLKSLISKGLTVPHRCENRYNRYWYINSLDGRSFLGQSGHFMRELALENDGDLAVILAKTQETLEPLMPSNLCDFDRVNWDFIGLTFLWGELFDEIEDL